MFEDLTWLKIAGVIVISMVIQDLFLNEIAIFGSHVDLMLVLPVTAAIIGGAELGAFMGFFTGFAADLLLPTPFGLSALVYVLVGYAVGSFVSSAFGHDFSRARVLGTTLGCLFGTLFYAVVAAFIGQPGILNSQLIVTTMVVGVGGFLLAIPAFRAWNWALRDMRLSSFHARMPSGGSALR